LEGYQQGAKLAVVKTIMATGGKCIKSLAVHPSKRWLLVSTGLSIMIWNTTDWTCSRMFHGPGYFDTVKHASFNTNDDRVFGIGCCDGTVKVFVSCHYHFSYISPT
jgi:WD40 repeat protein